MYPGTVADSAGTGTEIETFDPRFTVSLCAATVAVAAGTEYEYGGGTTLDAAVLTEVAGSVTENAGNEQLTVLPETVQEVGLGI